jgi:hypothetical protein
MSQLRRQEIPQFFDLRAGQHAAVAHQHEVADGETLSQRIDLIGDRGRIARVARIDRQGHRAPAIVGQQAVGNRRQFESVPVMTPHRQRTMRTVVGTAR